MPIEQTTPPADDRVGADSAGASRATPASPETRPADTLMARVYDRLAVLEREHARVFAIVAASEEWQRLTVLGAAIGELQLLLAPPPPPPAAAPPADEDIGALGPHHPHPRPMSAGTAREADTHHSPYQDS